ncbi:MAG: hypothetical protein K1X51_06695 [Rhodospirillaceae bacterium]|nr:hypothetical protein [Rhodospirillaceae bacterium]
MKSSCELIVDRRELLTAIATDGPATRPMKPDDAVIAPHHSGILIFTASLTTELKVVGRWDRLLLIGRDSLQRLLSRSTRATTQLVLINNHLQVDRTLLEIDFVDEAAHPYRTMLLPPPTTLPYQRSLFPCDTDFGKARTPEQRPHRALPLFESDPAGQSR